MRSSTDTPEYKVIVIGLGAHGSAILHSLSESSSKPSEILGIDQYPVPHPMGSSHGESRMMRLSHPSGNPVFKNLANRSKQILEELSQNISSTSPMLTKSGSLFISKDTTSNSMLTKLATSASSQTISHEVIDHNRLGSDFTQFKVTDQESAYYEHESQLISASTVLEGRLQRAKALGAQIKLNESVMSFDARQDYIEVTTTDGRYTTEKLVVASGPWIPQIAKQFNLDLPVYPSVMHWFKVSEAYQNHYSINNFPITVLDIGEGGSILVFPLADDNAISVKVMHFPGTDAHSPKVTPETIDRKVSSKDSTYVYNNFIKDHFNGITPKCTDSYVCQYTQGPNRSFVVDFLPNTNERVAFVSACSRQGFKYSSALGEAISERVLTGSNSKTHDVFSEFGGHLQSNLDTTYFALDNERSKEINLLSNKVSYGKSISAYAFSVFLMALSFTINAKLIVHTSEHGAGAASIVSTFQTLVLGTATGCVLSSGIVMGEALGKRNYQSAGDAAKASWIWTASLAVASTALLLTSQYTLPLTFNNSQALEASKFFLGYGVGTIPTMFLMTTPQLASQAGSWKVPSVVALLNYGIGLTLSYLLGVTAGIGTFGVGLGGGISPWPVAIGLHYYLTRSDYAPLKLYRDSINNFKDNLIKLLKKGLELALQRTTEWGNLFVLTAFAALWSKHYVAAINASIQMIVIISLASQGVAHGIGMRSMILRKQMQSVSQENKKEAVKLHRQNTLMILKATGINILINFGCGLALHFLRKQITEFFINGDTDTNSIKTISENLLSINALGLIGDAPRITLGGGLRGWYDITYPTMVSLVLMTVVAAPLGLLFNQFTSDEDSIYWLFGIRGISMVLSAAVILHRLAKKVEEDANNNLGNYAKKNSLFRVALSSLNCCSGEDEANESLLAV